MATATAANVIELQPAARDTQEADKKDIVFRLAETVDRWCWIHRNEVKDKTLTESQRYTHLKREVAKRLQEGL